jgi:heme/copper-type cytochrome/quinol oxidase subunit 2
MSRRLAIAATLILAAGPLAHAGDPTTVTLTLKDHRFTPAEIHVPADTPVVLTVRNEDDSAEEIDSSQLKIEKVVAAGQEVRLTLRPLAKGTYPLSGEYHEDSAKAVLVVE